MEDAIQLWPAVDPCGYIYNRINGEIGLMSHYEQKYKPYENVYGLGSYILPGEVQGWIDKYVEGEIVNRRPKSLILWGPTRLGKTDPCGTNK